MQTFLSEPGMYASVDVLDNKRLQKQFLEGWQILNAISLTPTGGGSRVDGKVPFASNHPATNMWRGHEYALNGYLMCVRQVLITREVEVKLLTEKIEATMDANDWYHNTGLPDWYRDPVQRHKIQVTHRANLFKKLPEHYADYACESILVDTYPEIFVCCPGQHQPYYYPTHAED